MAGPRRAGRRRYVLVVVVLTAVTLITLDTRNGRSGPIGFLGRVAHSVVSPVQRAADGVASPVGDWWDSLIHGGRLRSDNRSLRQQLAAAQGRERAAQQAIDEDAQLRKLLCLDSLLNVKRVNSRIISRDPGNFDSTLTINRGSKSGIAAHMPVVSPEGYLVGTVIEVAPQQSVVRVLTDPEFSVGVKYPAHPPSNSAVGIASGQTGSRELLDDDIDAGIKVVPNDRVVTSPSAASDYPPDLLVGEVSRVAPQASGESQNVFIHPYVDLGGLDYVSVLLWVAGGPTVVNPGVQCVTLPAPTTTTTSTTTTTVPGSQFGVSTSTSTSTSTTRPGG
jgi:rod shape-determining protein MreC